MASVEIERNFVANKIFELQALLANRDVIENRAEGEAWQNIYGLLLEGGEGDEVVWAQVLAFVRNLIRDLDGHERLPAIRVSWLVRILSLYREQNGFSKLDEFVHGERNRLKRLARKLETADALSDRDDYQILYITFLQLALLYQHGVGEPSIISSFASPGKCFSIAKDIDWLLVPVAWLEPGFMAKLEAKLVQFKVRQGGGRQIDLVLNMIRRENVSEEDLFTRQQLWDQYFEADRVLREESLAKFEAAILAEQEAEAAEHAATFAEHDRAYEEGTHVALPDTLDGLLAALAETDVDHDLSTTIALRILDHGYFAQLLAQGGAGLQQVLEVIALNDPDRFVAIVREELQIFPPLQRQQLALPLMLVLFSPELDGERDFICQQLIEAPSSPDSSGGGFVEEFRSLFGGSAATPEVDYNEQRANLSHTLLSVVSNLNWEQFLSRISVERQEVVLNFLASYLTLGDFYRMYRGFTAQGLVQPNVLQFWAELREIIVVATRVEELTANIDGVSIAEIEEDFRRQVAHLRGDEVHRSEGGVDLDRMSSEQVLREDQLRDMEAERAEGISYDSTIPSTSDSSLVVKGVEGAAEVLPETASFVAPVIDPLVTVHTEPPSLLAEVLETAGNLTGFLPELVARSALTVALRESEPIVPSVAITAVSGNVAKSKLERILNAVAACVAEKNSVSNISYNTINEYVAALHTIQNFRELVLILQYLATAPDEGNLAYELFVLDSLATNQNALGNLLAEFSEPEQNAVKTLLHDIEFLAVRRAVMDGASEANRDFWNIAVSWMQNVQDVISFWERCKSLGPEYVGQFIFVLLAKPNLSGLVDAFPEVAAEDLVVISNQFFDPYVVEDLVARIILAADGGGDVAVVDSALIWIESWDQFATLLEKLDVADVKYRNWLIDHLLVRISHGESFAAIFSGVSGESLEVLMTNLPQLFNQYFVAVIVDLVNALATGIPELIAPQQQRFEHARSLLTTAEQFKTVVSMLRNLGEAYSAWFMREFLQLGYIKGLAETGIQERTKAQVKREFQLWLPRMITAADPDQEDEVDKLYAEVFVPEKHSLEAIISSGEDSQIAENLVLSLDTGSVSQVTALDCFADARNFTQLIRVLRIVARRKNAYELFVALTRKLNLEISKSSNWRALHFNHWERSSFNSLDRLVLALCDAENGLLSWVENQGIVSPEHVTTIWRQEGQVLRGEPVASKPEVCIAKANLVKGSLDNSVFVLEDGDVGQIGQVIVEQIVDADMRDDLYLAPEYGRFYAVALLGTRNTTRLRLRLLRALLAYQNSDAYKGLRANIRGFLQRIIKDFMRGWIRDVDNLSQISATLSVVDRDQIKQFFNSDQAQGIAEELRADIVRAVLSEMLPLRMSLGELTLLDVAAFGRYQGMVRRFLVGENGNGGVGLLLLDTVRVSGGIDAVINGDSDRIVNLTRVVNDALDLALNLVVAAEDDSDAKNIDRDTYQSMFRFIRMLWTVHDKEYLNDSLRVKLGMLCGRILDDKRSNVHLTLEQRNFLYQAEKRYDVTKHSMSEMHGLKRWFSLLPSFKEPQSSLVRDAANTDTFCATFVGSLRMVSTTTTPGSSHLVRRAVGALRELPSDFPVAEDNFLDQRNTYPHQSSSASKKKRRKKRRKARVVEISG